MDNMMQIQKSADVSPFDKHFEVILADTEYSRQVHYQLRYQVYCLDECFEEQDDGQEEIERDEWDSHSTHFLVRNRQTSDWVAAMRMVTPDTNRALPIEQLCDINPLVASTSSGNQIAEISRLCILNSYRRRQTARVLPFDVDSTRKQDGISTIQTNINSSRSLIMKGLLRAASIYSYDNNIPYWYFLTTPALARIVNRMGVQMIKAGSACNHCGVRYPFLANIHAAVNQAKQGCQDMALLFSNPENAYTRYSTIETPYRQSTHEDNYLVA